MRVLSGVVLVAVAALAWPNASAAQSGRPAAGSGQKVAASNENAAAEKTIIANERAINDAVAKADVARFRSLVSDDSWAVDPMSGRMATSEFVKGFDEMKKNMKMTSWDLGESQVLWASPTVAVHSYKWTGQGTYQGQPIPSPVWASTVWAHRGGKWVAVFHQESNATPPGK
jgi:ketosteroid isomerase-like protein